MKDDKWMPEVDDTAEDLLDDFAYMQLILIRVLWFLAGMLVAVVGSVIYALHTLKMLLM